MDLKFDGRRVLFFRENIFEHVPSVVRRDTRKIFQGLNLILNKKREREKKAKLNFETSVKLRAILAMFG